MEGNFEDLVEINPSTTMTFNLSSKVSSSQISIKSKSKSYSLALKIKTTKPNRYLVKKSIGILEPNQEASYMIELVPKDQAALRKEKPREHSDRFLVQVVEIVDETLYEEVKDTEKIDWCDIKDPMVNKINAYIKSMESKKTGKSADIKLKEKIIKVNFENPELVAYQTANISAEALREKINTNETAFRREDFHAGKGINGEDFKRSGKIDDAQTLRRKYDDLVSFVLTLEEERANLLMEIDSLNTEKRQLTLQREVFESHYNELKEKCDPNAVEKRAKSSKGGYTIFHLVVGVVLAAAAARLLPK